TRECGDFDLILWWISWLVHCNCGRREWLTIPLSHSHLHGSGLYSCSEPGLGFCQRGYCWVVHHHPYCCQWFRWIRVDFIVRGTVVRPHMFASSSSCHPCIVWGLHMTI